MTPAAGAEGPVVNHVGLCVTDLDRSRRFYVDVLGFTEDRVLAIPDEAGGYLLSVEPPVGLTAAYLVRGPFTLELIHFDRPGNPAAVDRPFTQPGLTHLSFSVEDLDASVALVTERGGQVQTLMPGMAAMIRDPDGQLLELLPMSYHRRLQEAADAPEEHARSVE